MRKLVPYTLATLLVASSTNAMMTTTLGVNAQKTPTGYPHLTSTCQELENPLNIIEQACNYVSNLSPNSMTLEQIEQILGIQQGFYKPLKIEEIERALDTAEEKIMQILALLELDSVQAAIHLCKIKSIVDELNEQKFELEDLDSFEPTNECSNIKDEKRRVIIPFLDWVRYGEIMDPRLGRTRDPIIVNMLSFANNFRHYLITLAQKEMDQYNHTKQIKQETWKNKSYWQKAYYYISNLYLPVDASDSISNNLETIKWNARWYETKGHKVKLKYFKDRNIMNLIQSRHSIYKFVKHAKKCSEFLKQENIQ